MNYYQQNSISNHNPLPKEENQSICSQLISFEKIITDKFNKDINEMNCLLNYIEKISSNYNQLYLTFNNIESYPKDNSENNIINSLYYSFYNFHAQIFDKIKNLMEKINTEVIPQLKKIRKLNEKENKKNLVTLKDIIGQISLHQDV